MKVCPDFFNLKVVYCQNCQGLPEVARVDRVGLIRLLLSNKYLVPNFSNIFIKFSYFRQTRMNRALFLTDLKLLLLHCLAKRFPTPILLPTLKVEIFTEEIFAIEDSKSSEILRLYFCDSFC